MAQELLFSFSGTRQMENLKPIPDNLGAEIIPPSVLQMAEAIEVLSAGGYLDRHGGLYRPTDRPHHTYAFVKRIRFVTYTLLWRYEQIQWAPGGDSATARQRGQ